MAIDASSVVNFMKLDTSKFTEGLNSAGQKMQEFTDSTNSLGVRVKSLGDVMQITGRTSIDGLTSPLVNVGTSAVKTSMNFEEQMSKVKRILKPTSNEFENLKDKAIQLGSETCFSASNVADGMNNLASSGFTTKQVIESMPDILNLAAAGNVDVATASDVASNALRDFGIETDKTYHITDVLAEASVNTKSGIKDTGEALKSVAPVAHALGISFEDTTAAIGILSKTGVKGAEAGDILKEAFTSMLNPTKEASQLMERLGMNFFDAKGKMLPLGDVLQQLKEKTSGLTEQQKSNVFKTLFGTKAGTGIKTMSGMLALVDQGPDKFKSFSKELKNCDGASKEMANTMKGSLKGSIDSMKSSIDSAGIKLGDALVPSIKLITRVINGLANAFTRLPKSVQTVIANVLLAVAAFGPVIVALGKIISSTNLVVKSFSKLGKVPSVSKSTDNPKSRTLKNAKKLNVPSSSFKNIGQVADKSAGQLLRVSKAGENVNNAFSKLAKEAKNVIKAFLNINSVSKKTVTALSKVNMEVKRLTKSLMEANMAAGKLSRNFNGINKAGNLTTKSLSRTGKSVNQLNSTFSKASLGLDKSTKSILNSFTKISAGTGKLGKSGGVVKKFASIFTLLPGIINPPVLIAVAAIAGLGLIVYTIIKNWSGFKKKAGAFWEGFKKGLKDGFDGMPGAFFGIGGAIVSGLIKGFENAFPNALEKMKKFGNGILNMFKNIMGINSPSRVFAEYGKFIGQGLINGISSMEEKTEDKVRSIGESLKNGLKKALETNLYSNDFIELGVNTSQSHINKMMDSAKNVSVKKNFTQLDNVMLSKTYGEVSSRGLKDIKNNSKLLNFEPKINLYVTVADTGEKGTAKLAGEVKSMTQNALKNAMTDLFMNDVLRD
ncbi:phage tail tape measure protein [Clostridium sp. P21]|uniref:Phage tail tape measure protein n=1 Tax=Clostridium muellerianum TaxID=2716538 RepID=A0A7Y0EFA1_9CLOT|nr:phage tail tape measure protein [Clostridium muellerianum]NMM62362.1 phage tail tape measure protein [Clostridium muellerianum]